MATNLKSIKGITSELKAAAEYTKNGFYVSLSLDPLCPFDLVVTDHYGNSLVPQIPFMIANCIKQIEGLDSL
jgi:hypothetical protein